MTKINDPTVVAEVTTAAEAYETALVTNDVTALQNFFWDSPEAVRFGVAEQLYGIEEINAFRRNRVINFSGRRGLRLTVTTFDDDTASVMYEYVSKISSIERQGRQSQVWRRIKGEWKIVSAHVSLAPFAPADGADWAIYAKHAAAALPLPLDPASELGVIRNLAVIADLSLPLMAFELPATIEPAPVFHP